MFNPSFKTLHVMNVHASVFHCFAKTGVLFHFQYELIFLSKLLASISQTICFPFCNNEKSGFLISQCCLKEFEFALENLSHSLKLCLDAMTAISPCPYHHIIGLTD